MDENNKKGDSSDGNRKKTKSALIKEFVEEVTVGGIKHFKCTQIAKSCTYSQKALFRPQNFERHIQAVHHVDITEDGIVPRPDAVQKLGPEIRIRMSKQTVISALIRLVTVHGLPFAAVEWEAVRDLTQPVLNVFKTVINRRNIVEVVDNVAAQIACLIAEELKGSRISLKLDIVSKMYRSFLGVNVQIITKGGKFLKRNLGKFQQPLSCLAICI